MKLHIPSLHMSLAYVLLFAEMAGSEKNPVSKDSQILPIFNKLLSSEKTKLFVNHQNNPKSQVLLFFFFFQLRKKAQRGYEVPELRFVARYLGPHRVHSHCGPNTKASRWHKEVPGRTPECPHKTPGGCHD